MQRDMTDSEAETEAELWNVQTVEVLNESFWVGNRSKLHDGLIARL